MSTGAKDAFNRIFQHAQCECTTHEVVLRGWDTDGVAKTRRAQEYTPTNCAAFVCAIVESCGSNQEGESTEWSDYLKEHRMVGLLERGYALGT